MPKGIVSPGIREIARQLDVRLVGGADPNVRLVQACMRKVETWLDELGPAETFDELLAIISAKLKIHFEVVQDDEDLHAIVNRYLAQGEAGFANLQREFDDFTDAAVLRLLRAPSWSNKQYAAVVDARGNKRPREWFSKWHEISHLIAEPQAKLVYRRTQATRRDPVERLMDQLAGELAFYKPLFVPALKGGGVNVADPRLSELVRFRDDSFEFASAFATFNAILQHSEVPCILVEAKTSLKATEQRQRAQGVLFEGERPKPQLRSLTTSHNPEAIRRKFYIHRWMRIPMNSIIRRVHAGEASCEHELAVENLSWWESSGEKLPNRKIVVEAMRAGSDRVLALVKRA